MTLLRQLRPMRHEKIEKRLRQIVAESDVGSFLPPEKALAENLGVSISTVRRGMEKLVAEGMVQRRRRAGTMVVRRMAKRRVGLLNDTDLSFLKAPQSSLELLQYCQQSLRDAGHEVLVFHGNRDPLDPPGPLKTPGFLEAVDRGDLHGVIALDTFPHAEWSARLERAGVPVVGVGEAHPIMVTANHASYLEHVISLLRHTNCRRVAYVGRQAFYQATSQTKAHGIAGPMLRSAGYDSPQGWVREDWRGPEPAAGWASFREIWAQASEKPEAVVVGTYEMLPEVLQAVYELRIQVPKDLRIIAPRPRRQRLLYSFVDYLVSDTACFARELSSMIQEMMDTGSIRDPRRYLDCWHPSESHLAEEKSSSQDLIQT
jgi:DNA-binding LacI/PurR family transcriptional regulator